MTHQQVRAADRINDATSSSRWPPSTKARRLKLPDTDEKNCVQQTNRAATLPIIKLKCQFFGRDLPIMSAEPTPSVWLQQFRAGDRAAVERLWELYFARLVRVAQQRLGGRARLVGDGEDIALSAFHSFCHGIERGRFPDLSNRDELWNLLVTITLHKVFHLIRDEGRAKRGGGRLLLNAASLTSGADFLQQLADSEPTPEVAAEMADELNRLLDALGNQELIDLALLKLEGHTNQEIAKRWQKAERTVERKLNLIRKTWEKQADLGQQYGLPK